MIGPFFNAATVFALTAMSAVPDVHLAQGPYARSRGQSLKNCKAKPEKRAKRKKAAKARKRNRR